jgi:predicted metal-dependent hydrolase
MSQPVTTHKSPRIAALLATCEEGPLPRHYQGYFACFDTELYYEAHDVLEELWLGSRAGDYFFYKGLIQLAGAFVHLQKDRLRPAAALFELARRNLKPFRPEHHHLDVLGVLTLIERHTRFLAENDYKLNPFNTLPKPILRPLVKLIN